MIMVTTILNKIMISEILVQIQVSFYGFIEDQDLVR